MLNIGNYRIEQLTKKNSILITLPQTRETLNNTVDPVEDRRLELTGEQLAMVLGIVKKMLDKGRTAPNQSID